MRRVLGVVAAVALITAACATSTKAPEVVVLPDYAAQVADLPSPANDRSLPDVSPDDQLGAYGFSRYHNTCAGGTLENSVRGTGATATAEECRAGGGRFVPVIPSWMMHAYVVPEFDPQGGVFAINAPSSP